jgi:hypothetical protein
MSGGGVNGMDMMQYICKGLQVAAYLCCFAVLLLPSQGLLNVTQVQNVGGEFGVAGLCCL